MITVKNKIFAEIMFRKITGMKAKVTLVGNGYNSRASLVGHGYTYPLKYKGIKIGVVHLHDNTLFSGSQIDITLFGKKIVSTMTTSYVHASTNRFLDKFGINV